jgi:hypothetical protein
MEGLFATAELNLAVGRFDNRVVAFKTSAVPFPTLVYSSYRQGVILILSKGLLENICGKRHAIAS